MPIFTPDERERLRDELAAAARQDGNLCGAAHTGSAATAELDRWSDIDLALCLKASASCDEVVAEWTTRLYQQHHAIAHVDVMRGATLFRVFLLQSTLQVDVAFWSESDFGPTGPNFRLIFGSAKPLRPAGQSNPQDLIGMAWLYALHVRSSLARGRVLQTDYMLSGMRNHTLELTCLRCGVTAKQGRGLDDLPAAEREAAARCIPRALEAGELKRALQETMAVLLREITYVDGELAGRLGGVLRGIAE